MFNSPASKVQSKLPKPPNGSTRFAPQGSASGRAEGSSVDPAAATGTSVIGNDLTILGEKITIISQNKILVDGQVQGDVHGKQVVISKDGSVTGTVCAEKIDVRGGVSGSIRALTVALHESARVDGDIVHQSLSIAEGAEFDGRVQRAKSTSELTPILDAEAFEGESGSNYVEQTDDEASSGGASLG
ncbi:MAG: bactofilin family protein [Hyphomicrobium sp.]